ncbi:PP2C family protein-serine/threonine phosphatase [Streptomyces sp. NRRL B-24484]|uniref:PP2C family protein-serine/threonine phosphatase n=1 Tax=Streptomyces sp. NRRL B-24484 TaxID=1463833 RepID=UPI0004C0412C|nr:PP2C family protein-serine/threonine phosphatase [Streptomyces sp. NRRL B-24484]
MDVERRSGGERPWGRVPALVLVPVGLLVVLVVVITRSPDSVRLGPLLVIAPALTPSFAGPRVTAAVAVLTVAAGVLIAVLRGGLTTGYHPAQLAALAALSLMIVVFAVVRERRDRQLARAQSVAEAAQRALLRPIPERIGPLQIATVYLAAEHEAQIGGDLYTATRTDGGARMIVGDVRGKGLAAVGESALLLSVFRLVAAEHATLPDLARTLDHNVSRYLLDFAQTGGEIAEHFVTALFLDIPDDAPVARMTNCGHPPPLLLRHGRVIGLDGGGSAPPLGLGVLAAADYPDDAFPFEIGDTLLLYTDGVVEARDRSGAFYPFADRVARWAGSTPEALVNHIRRDLLAHAGGRLGDDAAVVAVRRTDGSEHRLHGLL